MDYLKKGIFIVDLFNQICIVNLPDPQHLVMKEIADLNYIFITLWLVASIGVAKIHSIYKRKNAKSILPPGAD